jgi:RHS repeat-associated protein
MRAACYSLQALALLVFLFAASAARGQVQNVTGDVATPIPGVGHDYIHFLSETVNPATGSLSLRIDVPTPRSRGLTLPFALMYNSSGVNQPMYSPSTSQASWYNLSSPLTGVGWSYSIPNLTALQGQSAFFNQSAQPPTTYTCTWISNYVLQALDASRHALGISIAQTNEGGTGCGNQISPPNNSFLGGDAFFSAATSFTGTIPTNPTPVTVASLDGTVYSFSQFTSFHSTPVFSNPQTGLTYYATPSSIEDRNGNVLRISSSSGVTTVTDSLGRPVISLSGNSITVSGLSNPYGLQWATATSNFSTGQSYVGAPQLASDCTGYGISASSQSSSVIQTITLPNGETYQFDYGSNPYGLVDKITYPSGGYVAYTWGENALSGQFSWPVVIPGINGLVCTYDHGSPAIVKRVVSFDGINQALEQDFSYSTTWAPNGGSWTNKQTTVTTKDCTRATSCATAPSFQTVYSYLPSYVPSPPNSSSGGPTPVEQTVVYKDFGGATLRTETKGWLDQYSLACQLETLDTGLISGTFYSYVPSRALLTDKKEYDYGLISSTSVCQNGSSAPSGITPTRETATSYRSFANTPIFPAGPSILDRPSSVITYSGTTRAAEADYSYDQTAVPSVSNLPPGTHDETNYAASSNVPRGNATTITGKCLQACADSVSTYTFDETGQVLSKVDACGNTTCSDMPPGVSHTTTYSYLDNYDSPPSSNTNAYLTKITFPPTNGVAHIESFQYAYADGQLIQSTDQNNQVTNYSYGDLLRRVTEVDYPPDPNNGNQRGKTTYAYNDSPPSPSVTTSRLMNTSNQYVTSTASMDGLGHVVKALLATDPDCASGDRTDTTYTGLGQVYTVSNPYCTTGDSTYGLTTYAYDALGRTTQVTHPDNSTVLTTHTGRATQVQDEGNGTQRVARISQTDAFGRLLSLCEVASGPFVGANGASTSSLIGSGGAPVACGQDIGGTGFLINYQYNVLGNLLQVNQTGIAARTFTYDSLSRLLTASNPESGSISYAYDANGNLSTKTDARGKVTTIGYDALDRALSKAYSDTTPGVTNLYDAATVNGLTISNPVGRLVKAATTDGLTATVSSYDPMGRIKNQWQCTPQNCGTGYFSLPYGYDLLGNITSSGNGMGVTLSYSYPFGRLTQITSSLSDWYHPTTLVSSMHYNALGAITSSALGNGAGETFSYSNRTWLQSISTNGVVGPSASSGSATVSGSEQSIIGAPATSGTGSVNFSGSLQSKQVLSHAATSGTGTISISGGPDQSTSVGYVCGPNGQMCWRTVYDGGSITVTVNGFLASASYYQASTPGTIATSLASALNASGSPVTASASGGGVTMTAKTTGAASNYTVSVSVTYDTQDFSHASFTASSPSALTGGANATYTTVYDSGTDTITVNGHADTVSWSGSGTTTSSIASALASSINADSAASVSASASGASVNLTAKTTGASTNYSLSSSSSYDSTDFTSASFTTSNSGSALTGGRDAGATVYDSGNVWVTINGTQYSASYGQGSTATSLASSLAQAINGSSGSPVTATASTTTVSLASKGTGSSTNYSLSVGSSTSQSSSFSQPSFTGTASGGTMSGGANGAPTTLYSFSLGYAPDGNVISANDNVNGNWTYAYDPFNRLVGSNQNSGQSVYSYVYDITGNRWQQNGPHSMIISFTGNNSTNNNRMDGYSYDAAGNLLNDGVHGYTYDAENRLTQVDAGGTATYVYDATGRRIRKSAGGASVDYLYDTSGHEIAEVNSSGGWNRGEVYAGGTHLATYNNGTTYFSHRDWLGTERVRSNISGAACETISSLPFGDGQAISGSCGDPTPMHFTGKERDPESGLDNFGARYFGSSPGRFTRPDPIMFSKQKLGDPQQWNMYSYARNNPLRFLDPTGKYVCNGTSDQCKAIKSALDNVQKAANALKQGSDERKALEKVLSFYGKEGDKNSVKVAFRDLKGKAEAETSTSRSFFGLGSKTTTITFDLNQIHHDFSVGGHDEPAETAAVTAHEGQHGINGRQNGVSNGRAAIFLDELGAFRTQSYVNFGLDVDSAYGLWSNSKGFDFGNAIINAGRATQVDCEDNKACQ